MGGVRRRLERLERRHLAEKLDRAHWLLGQALDSLSDPDMARFLLAISEAFRAKAEAGGLEEEFEAFAGVFGADPAAVAGLGEEAQSGVHAWREAGGAAACASLLAAGDGPADEELLRVVEESRERWCKPRFHLARARPHLRGLLHPGRDGGTPRA